VDLVNVNVAAHQQQHYGSCRAVQTQLASEQTLQRHLRSSNSGTSNTEDKTLMSRHMPRRRVSRPQGCINSILETSPAPCWSSCTSGMLVSIWTEFHTCFVNVQLLILHGGVGTRIIDCGRRRPLSNVQLLS